MIDYIGPAAGSYKFPDPGTITTQKGEQQVYIPSDALCDGATLTACADGNVGILLLKQGQIYAAAFLPRKVFKDLYKEFVKEGLE